MREHIEVVYENGVLRPLGSLPRRFHEHQHLTVTVEEAGESAEWLADADSRVSLETVRDALAKIPESLAERVRAERDER